MWVEVEHFGYYDEPLQKTRIQLADRFCENPPALNHSWAHTFRATTTHKGKKVRDVQFEESTGGWIRAEDYEAPYQEPMSKSEAMYAIAGPLRRNVQGLLGYLDALQCESFEPEPDVEAMLASAPGQASLSEWKEDCDDFIGQVCSPNAKAKGKAKAGAARKEHG